MRRLLLGLALVACLPPALGARTALSKAWQPSEGQLRTRIFRLEEMRGDPRETIYFLPSSWEPGKHLPLMVALPGGRAIAADLVTSQPQLLFQAERLGFVVVIPSSSMAYGSVLPSGLALEDIHEAYVLAAIAEAETRFGTDPAKRFLIGFSSGGSGVWVLAFRHPDAFRGLAAIAPAGSPGRERLSVSCTCPSIWPRRRTTRESAGGRTAGRSASSGSWEPRSATKSPPTAATASRSTRSSARPTSGSRAWRLRPRLQGSRPERLAAPVYGGVMAGSITARNDAPDPIEKPLSRTIELFARKVTSPGETAWNGPAVRVSQEV